MKCLSCDVILSDFEAVRKYPDTEVFLDLCNNCYEEIEDLFEQNGEEDDKNFSN